MFQLKPEFNVPAQILIPTTKKVNGVAQKTFEESDMIFCSFKGYGGTELERDDRIIVENTAVVETWYRPDIKNNCKFKLQDNSEWEILNVENIDMRNMFLKIKVRSISGGA